MAFGTRDADLGAVTAKLLSTLVSMTAAYFAHRFWSFSHRARTGMRREYGLFVVINGATLLVGLAVVAVVEEIEAAIEAVGAAHVCVFGERHRDVTSRGELRCERGLMRRKRVRAGLRMA